MNRHGFLFSSYVFLEVCGKAPERFISICKCRGIPLYKIRYTNTSKGLVCTLVMRLHDFWRIRSVTHKSHCRLLVKKRLGLPFLLKKYRSRVVFFCGGIYCLWMVWLLSTFLWSISVSGGFIHTEEELLQYLKQNRVVCGMRLKNLNCDELERKMRLDYPDIGWVSAERKGTKLIIRIAEINMRPKEAKEERKSDLCAAADGIVVSVLCTRGTPLVSAGDVVKKGDVVISGIVTVLGDDNVPVAIHHVAAQGTVVLQSVKQYEYRFSDTKVIKQETGGEKKGISFYWSRKKIFSMLPSHNYEKYDIIQTDMSFFWNDYLHLPLLVKRLRLREYYEQYSSYSEAEIHEISDKALQNYIDYLEKNGTKVLAKDVTIRREGGLIVSGGRLVIQSEALERVYITED